MEVPGLRKLWDKMDQRPVNTTLLDNGTLIYHNGSELLESHIEWCQFPEETCSCPTDE